jgi:hypothetical protein
MLKRNKRVEPTNVRVDNQLHPTVAPLLEAATHKRRELTSLQAAHGIVALDPAIVVQPMVLLCHHSHPVDGPGNAAPPVDLPPTVWIPTHRIGTLEAQHASEVPALASFASQEIPRNSASQSQLLQVRDSFLTHFNCSLLGRHKVGI